MNCLVPDSVQPVPSRLARVVICRGSDPVAGSVNAHAAISSPETSPGTKRSICAGVPCLIRVIATWMVVPGYSAATAQCRATSRLASMKARTVPPSPPYRSANGNRVSPSSRTARHNSGEKRWSRSTCLASGATVLAAWPSTAARNSSSSGSTRSFTGPPKRDLL
jgi:hypothetical protein